MTKTAAIPRSGLKEMGTNQPWNWRLVVPKITKMTLVRPTLTNIKMTVRTDCAVSAWSPLPQSIKPFFPIVRDGGVGLWTGVWWGCPPPLAGIQNKANFPFHQPGLFNGLGWVTRWLSSQVQNVVESWISPLLPGARTHRPLPKPGTLKRWKVKLLVLSDSLQPHGL